MHHRWYKIVSKNSSFKKEFKSVVSNRYIKGLIAIVVLLLLFIGGYQVYMMYTTPVSVEVVSKPEELKARGNELTSVKLRVKNNLLTSNYVMVEGGIIPDSVSQRWFGISGAVIGSNQGTECCEGQPNIEDTYITLGAMESRIVTFRLRTPHEDIEDRCGDTEYYAGAGAQYTAYGVTANHCNFVGGTKKSGFEMYDHDAANFYLKEEIKPCPWWDLGCHLSRGAGVVGQFLGGGAQKAWDFISSPFSVMWGGILTIKELFMYVVYSMIGLVTLITALTIYRVVSK